MRMEDRDCGTPEYCYTVLERFLCFTGSFPNQVLVFRCLQYKSFETAVGKGEIARNEQFLLFPQCFLPVWRVFCHFYQI